MHGSPYPSHPALRYTSGLTHRVGGQQVGPVTPRTKPVRQLHEHAKRLRHPLSDSFCLSMDCAIAYVQAKHRRAQSDIHSAYKSAIGQKDPSARRMEVFEEEAPWFHSATPTYTIRTQHCATQASSIASVGIGPSRRTPHLVANPSNAHASHQAIHNLIPHAACLIQ
jgi:hypothetical protein